MADDQPLSSTLDTSINNALPRFRIGIFMDIKFKAGENVKSFAFFFLILGNKRDEQKQQGPSLPFPDIDVEFV